MDLYFWIAGTILLFILLPRALRWLSVLVALGGFFVGSFSNGGTDAAFIPFAMIAVWRWDRYGQGREAGIARWLGPVALGLACSIKQLPWFCLPFLAIGVYLESRRSGRSPRKTAGRYLGVVVAVFTIVNLPLIVLDPSAWWQGSITPMARPLVADGQGLVSLALHGITGGVDLRLLTVASGLSLLGVLAAFVGWYRQLKPLWLPVLVPVVFFFATRSFSSYLLDLFPVALVALITVERPEVVSTGHRLRNPGRPIVGAPPGGEGHHRRWRDLSQRPLHEWARLATATFALATCVTAALSFTGAPLSLHAGPASVTTRKLLRSVTVTVTNQTAAAVVAHVMVDVGWSSPSGFWTTRNRSPLVIGPHESRTVTLFPPAATYLPPMASDYVVQAYTTNPEALSTTNGRLREDTQREPDHR